MTNMEIKKGDIIHNVSRHGGVLRYRELRAVMMIEGLVQFYGETLSGSRITHIRHINKVHDLRNGGVPEVPYLPEDMYFTDDDQTWIAFEFIKRVWVEMADHEVSTIRKNETAGFTLMQTLQVQKGGL